MKQETIQKTIVQWLPETSALPSVALFPRVIRKFEDEPEEKPMIYGSGAK